jgi:hypothetical protein
MSLTIERAVEATREMHDLIGELNEVLGAAYEAHQRHGLSNRPQVPADGSDGLGCLYG